MRLPPLSRPSDQAAKYGRHHARLTVSRLSALYICRSCTDCHACNRPDRSWWRGWQAGERVHECYSASVSHFAEPPMDWAHGTSARADSGQGFCPQSQHLAQRTGGTGGLVSPLHHPKTPRFAEEGWAYPSQRSAPCRELTCTQQTLFNTNTTPPPQTPQIQPAGAIGAVGFALRTDQAGSVCAHRHRYCQRDPASARRHTYALFR